MTDVESKAWDRTLEMLSAANETLPI